MPRETRQARNRRSEERQFRDLSRPTLSPNRKEFAEATRSRADTGKNIADAAQDAMHLADCEAMLVTQSERGMTLVVRGGEALHVPALPVKVRDVSGAGDTVAAVLALTLAARADCSASSRGLCCEAEATPTPGPEIYSDVIARLLQSMNSRDGSGACVVALL
jgi:bifunctional ADP-heptose synthase (sugar kinase/adenylyltransferase)